MAFHDINPIEGSKKILDGALNRASKWTGKKLRGKSDFEKARFREHIKFNMIRDGLSEKLNAITRSFPSLDNFTEFYSELTKATLNPDEVKQALGAVKRTNDNVHNLTKMFRRKLGETKSLEGINKIKKTFIGRISSSITRLDKKLNALKNARKTFRTFPIIKQGLFTVCISGFPNVGKSTLLSKITTSKPEIDEYAFTTKTLNLGYSEINKTKIQFIDTPGTLARPEKMNNIERQAYLAVKYHADLMVYVFDLTEPYPLEEQRTLLKNLKKFKTPMILYLSKTDILDKKFVTEFQKEFAVLTDIKDLKKEIKTRLID